MNAHRIEMVVPENEKLTLEDLPFSAGTAVEIIVLEKDGVMPEPAYSLRGSILRYDEPFEPAAPQGE
jgi:hypothetical protein